MLAVPVLPGATLDWSREDARTSFLGAAALWVGAMAAVGAIAYGSYAALHGRAQREPAATTTTHLVPKPTPAATTPAHVAPRLQHPVTAEQRGQAAAARVARQIPVDLGSAALLRDGRALYVVGGSDHGTPSDVIRQVDLATGRVSTYGTFVEPLADAATARRAGVLYLAGGWTGEKHATAVLRWAPGQSSVLVARLPVSIRGGKAAFVGNVLYIAGTSPAVAFAVDVDTGTVTPQAKLPPALRAVQTNREYLAAGLGGQKPNPPTR
jgi:hypothetical protein